MQPLVRPLWFLHGNEQLARSIALLPSQPFRVVHLSGWDRLRSEMRRAPPAAIAVVDPRHGFGEGTGPSIEVRSMLEQYPSATVVAALHITPADSAILRTLGEWGVTDYIDLVRENSPLAVARRLRIVQSMPVRRMLKRALPRGLPSRPAGLLLRAAEVVAAGGRGEHLAQALGVHMRTVPRWCERADLPPPKRLLAWLRLLVASDLLRDPTWSLEAAARATGYASGPSLKTAYRNLMKMKAKEVRANDPFAAVAIAFERELSAIREKARKAGKPEKVWLV